MAGTLEPAARAAHRYTVSHPGSPRYFTAHTVTPHYMRYLELAAGDLRANHLAARVRQLQEHALVGGGFTLVVCNGRRDCARRRTMRRSARVERMSGLGATGADLAPRRPALPRIARSHSLARD